MRPLERSVAPLPLLRPLPPALRVARAANGPAATPSTSTRDANGMVARVVGHVANVVARSRVTIRVALDPARRSLRGNDRAMAFAGGGVLARIAEGLEAREDASATTVRVQTRAGSDRVRVVITSDELPALDVVRAITGTDDAPVAYADPAVVDCRRPLEGARGSHRAHRRRPESV